MNAFQATPAVNGDQRIDHLVIAELIEPGSRVLDVGSGDGTLLLLLKERLGIEGCGLELSQQGVNESVRRGLAVIQGDADSDLIDYPDNGFDYVILSQTLQATRHPRLVLEQLLRIGRKAIVSFPNFGYWRMRVSLGVRGRMPVNRFLPYSWYDTPNIHFCTIRDFTMLCDEIGARIEKAVALRGDGAQLIAAPWWFWNLFGQQAVFRLSR